ncbi:MAG: hypothetical protein JNL45_12265 [Hyphomicrobium sp.]|jgi:hypothetical protein|nr:hypothetical protein [Hyphomicrobium sp.]
MATRHLHLSKDGLENFSILVTEHNRRKELWIEVDHYFIPDASQDRKAIVLGLGGLDAKEFCSEVDKLIQQLERLKALAAREFSRPG